MGQKTRAALRALWLTGYTPTQADFDDFFDSSQLFADITFADLPGTNWDYTTGLAKRKVLSANTTLTTSNFPAGYGTGYILVIQDATGGRTLTIDGMAQAINLTAGTPTMISVIKTGFETLYLVNGNVVSGSTVPQLATPVITFGTITNTTIVINWTAITNANDYLLYRNTVNNFGTATLINEQGGTTYTDSSLTLGTTYYYFLVAKDLTAAHSNSNAGTNNTTTTGGSAVTLNAPVLTAGTPTATTVPLTWTDTNTSPNESSFEYHQSTDSGSTWVAATPGTAAANATGATAGSLTSSTPYQFRARAVGNGTTTLTSAWSNIVSATTASSVSYITWFAINANLQQYNSNKGMQKFQNPGAWNPAYGNESIVAGQAFYGKLDTSTGTHRILGLHNLQDTNDGGTAPGWKYEMYLKGDNTIDVFENGVSTTTNIGSWAVGDVFRLNYVGTAIKYEKLVSGTWTTMNTSAVATGGVALYCNVEIFSIAGFDELYKI